MAKRTHSTLTGRRVAAGVVFAGVVALSLGPDVNPGAGLVNRLDHVAAYWALTSILLWAWDVDGGNHAEWRSTVLLSLALGAFAGVMEIAQATFHRDADVLDWLAGLVGVAIAGGGHVLLHTLRRVTGERRDQASGSSPRPDSGPA